MTAHVPRINVLLAALALVIATLVAGFMTAPTVGAHTSTYCGHGTSGWWNITKYNGLVQQPPTYGVKHWYKHYNAEWDFTHNDYRTCGH